MDLIGNVYFFFAAAVFAAALLTPVANSDAAPALESSVQLAQGKHNSLSREQRRNRIAEGETK